MSRWGPCSKCTASRTGQKVELHNRLAYRLSTAVFTSGGSELVKEMTNALSTGCININRGTIGSSLRLPAVGQGRSANGIPPTSTCCACDAPGLRRLASL